MRGTLHFVPAADIRWMLQLIAPRTLQQLRNASRYNQAGLDEGVWDRSNGAIARALEGGRRLTRTELAKALDAAGISSAGLRLTFMLQRAQADGLICQAARRGRQITFALLDEWVPPGRKVAPGDAAAELARRYFRSHGPATVADFAAWSGLTLAGAWAGFEAVKAGFVREEIDGQAYWSAAPGPQPGEPAQAAHLLPNYDELTVGYRDRRALFDAPHIPSPANMGIVALSHVIVMDGQIVGTWRRSFGKGTVAIDPSPFMALAPGQNDALAAAARRYGEFFGLAVDLR
jgi:hypothetical protein